jgi:DNA polymerase III epsilon subunit-like protein
MTFIIISVLILIFVIFTIFKSKTNSGKLIALQPVLDKTTFEPIALIIYTETTGLINDNSIRVTTQNITDFENNFPKIVQLCYMLIDKNGNYEGETFFIKQEKKIPKEAIRIHGITDEICQLQGIDLKDALSSLTIASTKVDDIVGHNIAFDYKVLHAEFLKSEMPFSLKKKNKVDTMKLVGKYLGHKYGFRISLYNAAEKLFGNKKEWQMLKTNLKEHNAESDVFVTALIFNMLNGK